jgi:3-hydroxyacyl-CoA dehydrogenase / 3-hydroxy-2-methylbutyryl-CoA dehydrogenase
MQLAGSTAIVTGGASGLGEATVRRFVEQGANAVILDLDERRAGSIVDELGDRVRFAKADVASEEQVQAAVDLAVATFGSVHILVNCGGSGGGDAHRTVSREGPHSLEDFRACVDSYLVGTFNCIRLAAWAMGNNERNEDGEKGVIINTSSVSGFEGQIGQVAYAAAKAGVSGMTIVIARDLAVMGIRCNTIVPGFFMTPRAELAPPELVDALVSHMVFPKRPGVADEYAHLAQAIVENAVLNGENIRLDSGMRMGPK